MVESRLGYSRLPSSETTDDVQDDRACFCYLEGWDFFGSIGQDGEEMVEAIRYKGCGGTGHLLDR